MESVGCSWQCGGHAGLREGSSNEMIETETNIQWVEEHLGSSEG